MAADSISNADAVEAIDSQLRSLYRCFRDIGPSNPPLVAAIRQLHSLLKELRVEARQPNSAVNTASPSHPLAPILRECDESLKDFAAIVEKLGPALDYAVPSTDCNARSDISGYSLDTPVNVAVSPLAPVSSSTVLTVLPHGQTTNDQLAVVRKRFLSHAAKLTLFLTMKSSSPPYPSSVVASHSASRSNSPLPASSPHISPPISPMPSDDGDLEIIKDRIDAIADRLTYQDLVSASQSSVASTDDLWKVVYKELSYEGFSKNTLLEYKDTLRAYIQELGSRGYFQGTGASSPYLPPRASAPSLPTYMVPGQAPAIVLPQGDQPPYDHSLKEVVHHSAKDARLASQPRDSEIYLPYRPAPTSGAPHTGRELEYNPHPPEPVVPDYDIIPSLNLPPDTMNTRASTPRTGAGHRHTSSMSQLDSRQDSEEQYAINGFNYISTRRLLEIDWHEREQASGRPGSSYSPKLLDHGGHGQQNIPAMAISPSAAALVRQNAMQSQVSLSPSSPSRLSFCPPSSGQYRYNASVPNLAASSPAAFGIMIPGSAAPLPPSLSKKSKQSTELGPDSFGRPIPPEAIWTRMTRKRISPEVLARAGVRFEARPTFVAVLGFLNRDQIAEFARQSVEARRSWRHSTARSERLSPFGASPPDHASRPERRQSISDGREHSERRSSDSGYRSQTFPFGGSRSSSKDRGRRDSSGTSSASQGRGGSYPFIVSPPATEADSPSPMGRRKSILKNKNQNKVRYRDGELVEVSPDEDNDSDHHYRRHRSKSRAKSRHRGDDDREHRRDGSRSRRHDGYDSDSDRDRTRNKSRHRDSDRESSRRHHHHDDRSRDRDRERDRDETRHRDRSHERRRDHDRSHDRERERDRYAHNSSSYSLSGRSQRDGRDGRDGRERDVRGERDDGGRRRLRDTLGAASLGGVAGSFISVLTEAAHGF